MPATMFIIVRVSPEEHASLVKRHGKRRLGALLRELLGLPPRALGRPPKVKGTKPKAERR